MSNIQMVGVATLYVQCSYQTMVLLRYRTF